MEKVNVNLSNYQISKIKSAFKKNISVTLQFEINQFKNDGKNSLLLTKRQINKLEKHRKSNTGFRLEFSNNQLKEIKNGGLLKEILDVAEHIPIVKNYTGDARKVAKVVKEKVIPKFRNLVDWLDHELSNVEGSGLDENTLKYMKRNFKKKFSTINIR